MANSVATNAAQQQWLQQQQANFSFGQQLNQVQVQQQGQTMTDNQANAQTINAAENQTTEIQSQMNIDDRKTMQDINDMNQAQQTSEFQSAQNNTLAKQKAQHKAAQAIAQYAGG